MDMTTSPRAVLVTTTEAGKLWWTTYSVDDEAHKGFWVPERFLARSWPLSFIRDFMVDMRHRAYRTDPTGAEAYLWRHAKVAYRRVVNPFGSLLVKGAYLWETTR